MAKTLVLFRPQLYHHSQKFFLLNSKIRSSTQLNQNEIEFHRQKAVELVFLKWKAKSLEKASL
jgi:hypothetical protein